MALIALAGNRPVQDPPLATFLFGSSSAALLWLMVRAYVGYQWVTSGWGKVTSPKWMETGEALQGFWTNVVKIPETGKPAITFDWYRSFIQALLDAQAYTWFAKLIAVGELLVGVALVIGLFTGIAAFFGAMLNFNFMLAGTASTNPLLFLLAIGLVLAWKVAGYYGLDRFVLPALGTPWGSARPLRTSSPAALRLTPTPAPAIPAQPAHLP